MVTTSFRAAGTGDTGQAVEAACQPARKPLAGWRLPEGMRATLARRPLPFPFVMCPECFFLMVSVSSEPSGLFLPGPQK
ncbi:TPA: hypothetical protein IEO87_004268 [Escherichia coli]|nr:hypothetical protein [Escherichia coli]